MQLIVFTWIVTIILPDIIYLVELLIFTWVVTIILPDIIYLVELLIFTWVITTILPDIIYLMELLKFTWGSYDNITWHYLPGGITKIYLGKLPEESSKTHRFSTEPLLNRCGLNQSQTHIVPVQTEPNFTTNQRAMHFRFRLSRIFRTYQGSRFNRFGLNRMGEKYPR